MRSKLQTKLLFRKIAASRGRFVAIVLIILLGVLLFVGIKSVGPDLYKNAQVYMNDQKASDVQIMATTGLTKADLDLAKTVPDAVVEAEKVVTTPDTKNNDLFQFYSYKNNQKLNKPRLLKGYMPKADNEIVVDGLANDEQAYKLGETITVKTDLLKETSYKIVGFVTSPQFVNKHSRPSTSQGTVDYFAYAKSANFTQAEPSLINLRYNNLKSLNSFKSEYEDKVAARIKQIKRVFAWRAVERQAKLMAEIDAQLAQLADSEKQIAAAKAQLAAATNGQQTTTAELTAQEEKVAAGQLSHTN